MADEKRYSDDDDSNSNDGEEEEDEEEYDSEENEDYEDRPRKKKKRRSAADFILDEAEVDDDDDEEDVGDAESDFEQLNKDFVAVDEGPSAKEIEGKRRLNMLLDDDEEKVANYYKEKYVNISRHDIDGEGKGMVDEVTQAALLPSIKDPNLWLLRCRMGEEKATALQLMSKMIAYEKTGQSLGIQSVVAREGLRGYLYIESHKQANVKKLIEGVSNLDIGKYRQDMVSKADMPMVLKVVKQVDNLKVNQWVRLKRGVFKDDLARVEYVEPCQRKIHLKLIPRIDYTQKRGFKRTNQTEKRKRFKRNPQKLFDAEAIKELGGEVTTDGTYTVFEDNRYMDGFLFKVFNINALLTEGITPTLSELQKFESQNDGGLEVKSVVEIPKFEMGDMVEVIEGGFTAMQGRVINIDGTRITVKPSHKEFDTLVFEAYTLKKFFKIGDHVRVLRGKHERETGSILSVEENLITVLSDVSTSEFKVLPKDLQLCSEVASGVDSYGKFTFGDLVQIDAQTVGVIIRMEKESFTVLDMYGKERVGLRPNELSKKATKHMAMALDCEQKNIKVKDVVKVIDGPLLGRRGEVKYVYRYFIFLYSNEHHYFVCRNKHLILASSSDQGHHIGGMTDSMLGMSPRLNNHQATRGGRGGGSSRWRNDKENKEWLEKSVLITQGVYKSKLGVVKGITNDTARVELHSEVRVINVELAKLKLIGDGQLRSASSFSHYARTPNTMPTPIYGSQTPQPDGSRTPYAGTPRHEGSMTPNRHSAWDPSTSNTPARHSDYDDMNMGDDVGTPGSFVPFSPNQASPLSVPVQSPSAYDSYHMLASPMAYSPTTPGLPPTPSTPLASDPSDWVAVKMVVVVGCTHDELEHIGSVGVVKSTTMNMCSVELKDSGKVIRLATQDLQPAMPDKGDRVRVIRGTRKDCIGTLQSVSKGEGVVNLDGEVTVLALPDLCKIVP